MPTAGCVSWLPFVQQSVALVDRLTGHCRQTGTTVQDDRYVPREAPPLARRGSHAYRVIAISKRIVRHAPQVRPRLGERSLLVEKQADGATTSFAMTLRHDVRWLGMSAK
jgi:hypothetical protein